MGISEFVEFEDTESIKQEHVVIIDGNNIANIVLYSNFLDDYANGDFRVLKIGLIQMMFDIIIRLKATRAVIAFDSGKNWRYEIFKEYKANRKKQYGRYTLDKKAFVEAINEVFDFLHTYMTNMMVIKVDNAEGDDIIAVGAKYIFNKENYDITVVSTDKDMYQLLMNSNVRIYNPRHSKYVEVLNPKMEHEIKLIIGDKNSDNIPGIKRMVGKVTAEKIIKSPDGLEGYINSLPTKLEQETVSKNYELNTLLIDFDYIRQDIVDDIKKKYKQYKYIPLDGKKLTKELMKRKLTGVYKKWNMLSEPLKRLK